MWNILYALCTFQEFHWRKQIITECGSVLNSLSEKEFAIYEESIFKVIKFVAFFPISDNSWDRYATHVVR